MGIKVREHEKLIAFISLLVALMSIAWLNYAHPLVSEGPADQLMSQIVGALTLALGAAAQALFRASTVKVDNPPSEPIPVEPAPKTAATDGELPEDEKIG